MIGTKLCSKCNQRKPLTDFYARKTAKDGRQSECKECNSKRHKKFYLEHVSQYRESHALYHANNYERIRKKATEYANSKRGKQKRKEYYEAHKTERREYERQYREKNKSKIHERRRRYYRMNKAKVAIWKKRYKDSHKDELLRSQKRYREEHREEINNKHIERLHNDPLFKLKEQLRCNIRNSLKKKNHTKSCRTTEILGCSFDEACEHLFSTWKENYGKSWDGEPYHIDHIIPLSTATTKEEVIKLCHYTNLQLLSPEDNMAKSDNLFYIMKN